MAHSAKFADAEARKALESLHPAVNSREYAESTLTRKYRVCLSEWIAGPECWELQDRLSQLIETETMLERAGDSAGLSGHLSQHFAEYEELRKGIERFAF